jgi:hypothetical protein
VKPETSKLLQENLGKTLDGIGIAKYFLIRTSITQEIRIRIDKLDYSKLKSSTHQRKQLPE